MTTLQTDSRHSFVAGTPANAGRPTTKVLTMDDLRRLTPSVFATAGREDVSSRYRFIPTTEVIDILGAQGFRPVRAGQTLVKTAGRDDFAKHVLRFRHEGSLDLRTVGDEVGELVLSNSHDRSSAYQLMMGIYRLICSNGAVVQSADFGSISVRHSGSKEFEGQVLDATFRVVEAMPHVMDQIEVWKQIELSQPQQVALATAALQLRENKVVTPQQLLAARRYEDKKPDLWTTSQRIQENIVQGGQKGRNAKGGRATTRPIKSVDADLKTNRALWMLTTEMAKLVGAN